MEGTTNPVITDLLTSDVNGIAETVDVDGCSTWLDGAPKPDNPDLFSSVANGIDKAADVAGSIC